MANDVFRLAERPVHLGLGATVVVEERFTGRTEWYEGYGARHASDGAEGRLVSLHTFSAPWPTWEIHPRGEELVACLAGELILHQEIDGAVHTVVLHAGEAIVNPACVWHTADVSAPCQALFITAGMGTEVRPR